MRILIVDDSRESQNRLATPLREAEFADVIYAASADEACRILGLEGDAPPAGVDLILMNTALSGADGVEATRRIKASPRTRDVPLILVMDRSEPDVLRRGLDAGATDFVVRPFHDLELLTRVVSTLRLRIETDARRAKERELQEAKGALEQANRELERLSSLDGLTGLANRRLFDRRIQEEWERARRDHTELGLLMIDIDHFKAYNDAGGHLAGDECLKRVAGALARALKLPADLVARYGGEEFGVLLPRRGTEGAALVGERIRRTVESMEIPHPDSRTGPLVTISVGAAGMIPAAGIGPAVLVAASDRALYDAKRAGRNRVGSARGGPP